MRVERSPVLEAEGDVSKVVQALERIPAQDQKARLGTGFEDADAPLRKDRAGSRPPQHVEQGNVVEDSE